MLGNHRETCRQELKVIRPQREGSLVPLLSLALLILAGLTLWVFFTYKLPGDDSVEAGFARDMMVHHAQAVEMAEIVRDKTESEDIQTLALDTALTQLPPWGLGGSSGKSGSMISQSSSLTNCIAILSTYPDTGF